MPGVIDNQNSISDDFVNISNTSIKEVLIEKLGPIKSELEARDEHDLDALLNQDTSSLIKIWKNIERSENSELNDASDLADLITGQIAEFDKEKLLEMCTLSKIAYGDGDRKLKKDEYETKRQFEEAGYQIIKFYDNELIQDKYCSDSDYKLEQHNVGYALTGSNSYNRDVGYVFIKDKEVTIAYHGTRDLNDLKEDLRASLTKLSFLSGDNYIHSGFYSLFKRSWPSVHKILQGHANDKGLEGIKSLKINVTGHSMRGALATIAALCLDKTEEAKDINVATFGSPRVFYNDAAEVYSECLGKKTIRVACQSDPVPCLPHGNAGAHYKHVGKPLKLETDKVLDYLEPYYHKIDTYYKLIREVKQENFKSDSNASRYFYISYVLSPFYHLINCLLNFTCIDGEKFFEEVRKENKDIKLSEIPIEYAPKLEEKLKQEEQECDELNDKVAQLTQDKSQLKETLKSTQQSLNEKTEELNSKDQELNDANQKLEEFKNTQAQFAQEKKKLNQGLDAKAKELKSTGAQLAEKEEKISKLNNQVTKFTEESSKLKEQYKNIKVNLENSKTGLDNANENILKLKEDLEQAKQKIDDANQKVSQLQAQLEREQESAKQELAKITREFESKEANLENSKKELDDKNKALNAEIQTFKSTQTQLEQERDSVKQELVGNTSEVTQLTEENNKLKNELKLKKPKNENNDLKTKLQESETKSKELESQVKNLHEQLESKNRVESQIQCLQEQLEGKNKELNSTKKNVSQLKHETLSKQASIDCLTKKEIQLLSENSRLAKEKDLSLGNENKKLSAVNAQSRKQVIYASVSFLLSVAFAVGASLTMFHLAMCISLAVAALTFLAVGCYCSYEANTALSNVEIDQTNGIDLADAKK
ncbi:lipase family protein [Wolbachia endosymbiont (group A) of Acrocera orbiculus]|uniref:lipase family protein n=1 Tax=Wolbachia endosymbiont (group A) of Acrocera orbiculus TaxID=2953971 RepID=UPI0022269CBE|nr:lipase [Wolbachia endosymbiont (group A) of Acrocera orbiculus]